MINRYQGNSGRMERFPEPGERTPGPPSPARPPPAPAPAHAARANPLQALGNLGGLLPGRIGELLPERIGELETEDYILLLILYLMYRESGDSELLIIMGAMFLL